MKILLADDQSRVRFALRVLLEQQPGWLVVGEAKDAGELLAQAGLRQPDVVLVDADLPGGRAAAGIEAVRVLCPGVCIIALGEEPPISGDNIEPDAFASKANPPEHLLAVIRACWHGRARPHERSRPPPDGKPA